MEQYVGLDVSLELTSVCVVDNTGKTVWQGKCASVPEVIATTVRNKAPGVTRVMISGIGLH
jgi:transposase